MIDDLHYLQQTGDINSIFEKSIDDVVLDPILEERRRNFEFPKDFSFKDKEFRNLVLDLYGRTTFDWSELGRKERRRVRQIYHEKVKNYFIRYYGWTPGTAAIVAGMTSLPRFEPHKNILGKCLEFIVDSAAGSLPERYSGPIAQLHNKDLCVLTKRSIIFDAAQIGITGFAAYSLWTGGPSDLHLTEQLYTAIGVGQDVLKWWLTGAAISRVLEVTIRTTAYKINKTHTPSPAMMFPININPLDGIPVAVLFGQDAWKKIKKSYRFTKNKYNDYFMPKVYSSSEINTDELYLKKEIQDYTNTDVNSTSKDAKTA